MGMLKNIDIVMFMHEQNIVPNISHKNVKDDVEYIYYLNILSM